ncbi:MAG: amidohydrolase family protein [Candidatus Latescibacteria bacterium]|nr:amidohydrolase family protein [Candidatus Latescibacterota bacterium]
MIVDTHVHIWEISAKYPVGPTAPNFTSTPDEPATADQLIEDMDQNGVDRTVLVQTSWSTWDNGYIADSQARFPDRFIGHGMLDPQEPDNAQQARYWMQQRGLVGFRFHPMYYADEKILTTPQNGPLWETLSQLGAVVQFHLTPPFADQVDEIARRYPHMPLLLDHMGYPQPDEPPEAFQPIVALATHANVAVKISDVHGRSKEGFPYADMHPAIKRLHQAFGAERMLWGTGYPGHHRTKHNWPTLAEELRLVREGFDFLSGREKDQMLGGTAARIWDLD